MSKKYDVLDALYRRAVGHEVTHRSEEYSVVDGDMTLVKKKIFVRELPPELSAIKFLMEKSGDDYDKMDEEQLEKERKKFLKELAEIEKTKKRKNKR